MGTYSRFNLNINYLLILYFLFVNYKQIQLYYKKFNNLFAFLQNSPIGRDFFLYLLLKYKNCLFSLLILHLTYKLILIYCYIIETIVY